VETSVQPTDLFENSGIAWHGTIIWYWQNGIKTGITAMSRKRSNKGLNLTG
jgi:hypothetical protein